MASVNDFWKRIKPLVVELLSAMGGGSGPYAPTPHSLNSAHHTGEISDSQHGVRTVANAHAHGHLSGVTADQHHAQVHALSGGDHTGTLGASQLPTTAIVEADAGTATPQTVDASGATAGSGRKYARENHKHILNFAMTAIWTGIHTFQNLIKTRHIEPEAGELYDIGSVTKRYRTLRVAELAATLFSKEAVMVLGNKLTIAKDAGALAAAVSAVQTTVNFGQVMTPGDWVQIAAEDTGGVAAVEWLLVGSLVSGTTYNVTRNVDGSGANAWAEGTPYLVIGQNGDYRIELAAGNPPTIKIIKQGATWNTIYEQYVVDDDGPSIRVESGSSWVEKAAYKFKDSSGNILTQLRCLTDATHTRIMMVSERAGGSASVQAAVSLEGDGIVAVVADQINLTGAVKIEGGTYYRLPATSEMPIVDLAGEHYDPIGPMLSAPACRGAWNMQAGYKGTGATAIVPDLSGQDRDLTIGGTVTFPRRRYGNYPEIGAAVIAAGVNYLERTDEVGVRPLDYFTAMGWFYVPNVDYGADQFVVGKASTGNNSTDWTWGVWIDSAKAAGSRVFTLDIPNGTTRKFVDGTDVTLWSNTWYFVAARFKSATEIALFVGNSDGLYKHVNTSGIGANMNNSAAVAFRILRRGDGSWPIQGGEAGMFSLHAADLDDRTIRAVYESQRRYFGS